MVTDDDQIMLVSSGGKVVRMRVNEIRVIGRNTQGVRLVNLEPSEGELMPDTVAAVTRVVTEDDDAAAGVDGDGLGDAGVDGAGGVGAPDPDAGPADGGEKS